MVVFVLFNVVAAEDSMVCVGCQVNCVRGRRQKRF